MDFQEAAVPMVGLQLSLLYLFSIPAAIIGVWGAWAEDAAPASEPIKDLLATKVGEAVCYAGAFTRHRVNVWDYSKAKQMPVPGLFRFGEQVTRAEPAVYPDQEVSSLTVLLYRDDRQHDSYDEMHDFVLKVTLTGWPSPLSAAGECPWRAANQPVKGTDYVSGANTTTLYCGIECDGGGMEIERVAGSTDVIFRFNAMSGGLRMSGGCSSGNLHLGGEAKPFDPTERHARENPTAFWLTRMSDKDCASFRTTKARE